MKKCFQKKKNFPRQNLTWQKNCGENSGDKISSCEIGRSDDIMNRNLTRRTSIGQNFPRQNLTRRKCHAVKLSAAKISVAKVSCAEISGCEIFSGEISRGKKTCGEISCDEIYHGENVIRRNFCW